MDREYYQQLRLPSHVRRVGFPANKVADDGRVLRQYGVEMQDVTEQFIDRDHTGKLESPSRQLHVRNVNQLKIALDMPPERYDPLAQVADAIINNDVVPPLPQLDNDKFLRDRWRKPATHLKLPPLRNRMSLQKALRMEQVAGVSASGSNQSLPYRYYNSSEENVDFGAEFPCADRKPSFGNSDHFNVAMIEQNTISNVNTGTFRRNRNCGANYRFRMSTAGSFQRNAQDNVTFGKRYRSGEERKDSVGRISDAIHDQFRTVVEQHLRSQGDAGNMNVSLAVNLKQSPKPISKQMAPEKSKGISGYQLRHEYGKNLEKNWFRNEYLGRRERRKSVNEQRMKSNKYDLRLDIFYSPEPQSESDTDNSADDGNAFIEDEASMQCGGFSTATAEVRLRRQRHSIQLQRQPISMETHEEEEEDTDDGKESSEDDYEIVLKDNQLIQRRTKHRMRNKRKRQIARYRAFMPPEVVEEAETLEEPVELTDQEIRALRLNLRGKEKQRKLRGKRKFLQVANAVFVAVQFRNILQQIRQRKKQLIKNRQQRIAKMVVKRFKAKLKKENEEKIKPPTPKPNMRDRFLREMGQKLIYDVQRLNINADSGNTGTVENDTDTDTDSHEVENQTSERQETRPCKFELELRKVSLSDIEGVNMIRMKRKRQKRHRKRRNSFPKVTKPNEFVLEVPERSRRKRNNKKVVAKELPVRRPQSPPIQRCSCYKHASNTKPSKPPVETSARPQLHTSVCQHQSEVKRHKMKTVRVPTIGLMKTYSLENLAKKRPVELADLLKDVHVPAKEIKLQILERKFRRQRRKRQQIRLSPVELPERPLVRLEEDKTESETESSLSSASSDISQESDYEFVYGGPFVGSGVMWNKNSFDRKQPTWTDEDLNRELRRITRVFHEMKECRYLRLDSFNDALRKRLENVANGTNISNHS